MQTVFTPYNTKTITASIEAVLKSGDMGKLTKAAYQFATLYHGFIAHYDIHGFRAEYARNVHGFAVGLQNGEYCTWGGRNRDYAERWRRDPFFADKYGQEYADSVARTMIQVVNLAAKYEASCWARQFPPE